MIFRADYATPLNLQRLALTSPTICSRFVGIVRSRTKATELSLKSKLVSLYNKILSLTEPDRQLRADFLRKIYELRRFIILWASTACYRESLILSYRALRTYSRVNSISTNIPS
jgi:hypothetical protein